jgi:hypothetical protein
MFQGKSQVCSSEDFSKASIFGFHFLDLCGVSEKGVTSCEFGIRKKEKSGASFTELILTPF